MITGAMPCTKFQFTCLDGSCIDLEEMCDGKLHCDDETYEDPGLCGDYVYNSTNVEPGMFFSKA